MRGERDTVMPTTRKEITCPLIACGEVVGREGRERWKTGREEDRQDAKRVKHERNKKLWISLHFLFVLVCLFFCCCCSYYYYHCLFVFMFFAVVVRFGFVFICMSVCCSCYSFCSFFRFYTK